ncbi:MAG: AmmeMemoRadiSam system protein B [Candidatus Latescibacterota bacterium]|nr:AmmeMemoRadiSam system protein B [Candidatus Latescibacterota bacterium]
MSGSDLLPRLRYVDAFPVDVDGQRLIYLRDPEGLAKDGLYVSPHLFELMALLDGDRSTRDLQKLYAKANEGAMLGEDQVDELISSLDEALLLDSERFQKHRADVKANYRNEVRRPSPLAGRSYPDDPDALRLLIDSFFEDESGPPNVPSGVDVVTGIVAPHIDFARGGPCFAWAYNELRYSDPADIYVVLGTGHTSRSPFSTTRKVFETPLGDLKVDSAFVDRLVEHAPQDLFEDEIAHKNEHSIEFQAVFLQYLFPDADIKFVPILCGSFSAAVDASVSPMEHPEVEGFVVALKKTLDEETRNVCLIAGVDFSHVGERFGDQGPMTDAFMSQVRSSDLDLTAAAESLDSEAFFDVIVRDYDRHRVCGTSSIFTMLQVLKASRGKLLKYDQAVDREEDSMVTYASMAFYE